MRVPEQQPARARGQGGLAALCLIWLAWGASAEPTELTAQQWLERMSHATRTKNFVGTFVYRRGTRMDSMRIVHRVDADGEKERLVSLDGAQREVVRDEAGMTCRMEGHETLVVDRVRPLGVLGRADPFPDSLLDHYGMHVRGRDRVADRDTVVVAIEPRDEFRYGYRFWIDESTALPLRAELVGEQGETLEQVLYTSISTPELIADAEVRPAQGAPRAHGAAARENPGVVQTGWVAAWLPSGFGLVSQSRDTVTDSHESVDQMLYSDGLASFSVFVESADPHHQSFEGPSRVGAFSAYGAIVVGHQVTVVGEVPPITVERVARTLRSER